MKLPKIISSSLILLFFFAFLFVNLSQIKPAFAWSLSASAPDGTKVTFTCGGCPNAGVEIFVVNSSGTTMDHSGSMGSTSTWDWFYGPIPNGTYTANLVAFGSSTVATTTVTIGGGGGFPFTLGDPPTISGITATFSITPNAGVGSILYIKDLASSIPIPSGAASISWSGAVGPHQVVISAFGVDVSNTVSFTMGGGGGGCNTYDFNSDGKVDLNDEQLLAFNVGKTFGSPGFDSKFDLNSDGVISSIDVTLFDNCISAICSDLNADGKVDTKDAQLVAFHVGQTSADPGYDVKYDLNHDGSITAADVQILLDCISSEPIGSTGGGFGSGVNPCAGGTCPTAFGPISTDLKDFSTRILSIAIGIAGGIAFILMVIGSIRILTSQGDPKNVAGGREMIIAAVAGLLFLIFSVIILRFIGINLLGGVTGI